MQNSTLQSVDRFTRILSILNQSDGTRISEVARRARLSRAVVQRYIDSFLALGLIVRNGDRYRYSVTPKVLEFSRNAMLDDWRETIVRPQLLATGMQTGWPISFCGIRAAKLMVIENTDAESPMVANPRPCGLGLPLIGVAEGEVLLAHKPPSVQDQLIRATIAKDPSLARRLGSDADDIKRSLLRIRSDGYALRNEINTSWTAMAVPVEMRMGTDFAVSLRFHAAALSDGDAIARFLGTMQRLAADLADSLQEVDTRW